MKSLPLLLVLLSAVPCAAQAVEGTARTYDLSEVETAPRMLNHDEVDAALTRLYPEHADTADGGEKVYADIVIGADGRPERVEEVRVCDSAYVAPTMEGLLLARYAPATVGGQPVAVRAEQRVAWRVDRSGGHASSRDALGGVLPKPVTIVEFVPRPRNTPDLQNALERLYPPAAKAARTRARVEVRFLVDTSGAVRNVAVTHTTNSDFNVATCRAVYVLQFRPARVFDRPVPVLIDLPIEWRLPEPADRRPGAGESIRQRRRRFAIPPQSDPAPAVPARTH